MENIKKYMRNTKHKINIYIQFIFINSFSDIVYWTSFKNNYVKIKVYENYELIDCLTD